MIIGHTGCAVPAPATRVRHTAHGQRRALQAVTDTPSDTRTHGAEAVASGDGGV